MNKKYLPWIIGAAIVIIAVGAFLWTKKAAAPASEENVQTSSENTPASGQTEEKEGELRGVLKVSDDMERGNLMLVRNDRSIYLNTTRDFSKLIDKDVVVEIDGTQAGFQLKNIIEQ